MARLINVDNGGTLTDICVVDDDGVGFTKTLTTPFDLSQCLFDSLENVSAQTGGGGLAALLRSCDYLRYSTTQGTNALVQRKGPRLGLLTDDTTLADRLAQAASDSSDLFDALLGDRIEVVTPQVVDDPELVRSVNELTQRGTERLIVSFTGPDAPAREAAVRAALLRLYPSHLLGVVPVLVARELTPDADDVRRTWSALLNAFLHPSMERFLFHAEQRLQSFRTRHPMLIFRNDGGSSRVAKVSALKTYGSGPRGGLDGVRALARFYGLGHVIMADVGGTTTDVGIVRDNEVVTRRRGVVDGVPTSFELSEIVSHGAGGSSIISVSDGRIQVGPDSVGAAPGPACFGLGGTSATITDVLLLMGYLDPATYLGGTMRLDAGRSRAAVAARIAEPLGIGVEEALQRMLEAFLDRVGGILRDSDPNRETVLAAFGGGGPMCACGAARKAGIDRILVPRTAAVFSAFGIGFSDLSQTYERQLTDGSATELDALLADLRSHAQRDLAAEHASQDTLVESVSIVGESSDGRDWEVQADPSTWPEVDLRDGTAYLVLRVSAPLEHVRFDAAIGDFGEVPSERTVLGPDGTWTTIPVRSLSSINGTEPASGPLIIEGPFFTMPVLTGWTATRTSAGDLMFNDEEGAR